MLHLVFVTMLDGPSGFLRSMMNTLISLLYLVHINLITYLCSSLLRLLRDVFDLILYSLAVYIRIKKYVRNGLPHAFSRCNVHFALDEPKSFVDIRFRLRLVLFDEHRADEFIDFIF